MISKSTKNHRAVFAALFTAIAAAGLPLPPGKPLFSLSGSAAKRVDRFAAGETDNERPPPAVFRRGREVYEWRVPDGLRRQPCVFVLKVRTGNNSADHINLVSTYRLWVVRDGREIEDVRFECLDGEVPAKTSKRWPVYTGRIVGRTPVDLGPGDRIRIAATGTWAQVHDVWAYPAPPRMTLALELVVDRPFHLFRRSEEVRAAAVLRSWRPEAADVRFETFVESPYGDRSRICNRRIRLAPNGRERIELAFHPRFSGPHYLIGRMTCGDETWKSEAAVGVVSVPRAIDLSRDSIFGVHPGGLTHMYQAGFKWIRLWDSGDVWAVHERAGKGRFDFSRTRAKVEEFRRQGFEVLAVLAYTPAWASRHPEIGYHAGAGASFPPKRLRDWRDYCREYMTRFKGLIRCYEVWNEPNTGNANNLHRGFFRGSVTDYVNLLRAAYETARSVDPDIRIIGCSGTGDFLKWTEQVLAAGGGRYMDVLSFHAYTNPRSPEEANVEGRLEELRRIMARYGLNDMPIWNTETGYWMAHRIGVRPATAAQLLAQAPPECAPDWKRSWPYRPVPEDVAAAWTVRHYVLNAAHGVRRLFWYSSIMSGFPLLCSDGTLRLPCFSIAAAAEQLDGFHWGGRMDFGLSRLHLHLFQKGGETRAAAWFAGDGCRDLLFPGEAEFRAFDIWGNPVSPFQRNGGHVLLRVKRDPIWLHGRRRWFQDARVRSADLVIPVTDCRVVRQVNPDRPVKEHTSPCYHGNRRVFGLPDKGDAIGWRLGAIQAGVYDVEIELRTGSKGALWSCLPWYRVTAVTRLGEFEFPLVPIGDSARNPEVIPGPEGGGRAYGWARVGRPMALEPGDEVRVELRDGFGFVGALRLRERPGARVPSVAVPRLAVRPVVDGLGEEATGVSLPRFLLRDRRQVVIGVADRFASTAEKEAWQGPDDLSAQFHMAWYEGGLWLFVEVVDPGPLHASSGAPWNGDALEVFLDLRSPPALGQPSKASGVHQIFIRAPAAAGASAVPRIEGDVLPGTEVRTRRTEKGWAAEVRMPVAGLTAGREIGFDLAVDDDDDGRGRSCQMVWHGNADDFQDPSRFARVRLSAE